MALLVTTIDVFSAGMEATSTHSDLVIYIVSVWIAMEITFPPFHIFYLTSRRIAF